MSNHHLHVIAHSGTLELVHYRQPLLKVPIDLCLILHVLANPTLPSILFALYGSMSKLTG